MEELKQNKIKLLFDYYLTITIIAILFQKL